MPFRRVIGLNSFPILAAILWVIMAIALSALLSCQSDPAGPTMQKDTEAANPISSPSRRIATESHDDAQVAGDGVSTEVLIRTFTPTASHLLSETSPESDKEALIALFRATDGEYWDKTRIWLGFQPIGEWPGVTTDEDGRVTNLELSQLDLSGQLPRELGNLSNLKVLNLAHNQLSGPLPAELGNLSNLRGLYLADNELSGPVPAELGNLSNLSVLYLAHNKLSGPLPAELGNLSKLNVLSLSNNQLRGVVLPSLDYMANLTKVEITGNRFTGCISDVLRDLSSEVTSWPATEPVCSGSDVDDATALIAIYKTLNMSGLENWLTREPLGEWEGVSTDHQGQVVRLNLEQMNIAGRLLPELAKLVNLRVLDLYDNRLSGELPPEFGELVNLRVLNLSSNRLSGELPAEWGNLINLRVLQIHGNSFRGELPSEWGNLRKLERLDLRQSSIAGNCDDLPSCQSLLGGDQESGSAEISESLLDSKATETPGTPEPSVNAPTSILQPTNSAPPTSGHASDVPLTGFTLLKAADQSVVAISSDGSTVTLDHPSSGGYGIRVEVKADVNIGSVRLELSGAKTVSKTENIVPYSLYGDDPDGLHGEALPAGA